MLQVNIDNCGLFKINTSKFDETYTFIYKDINKLNQIKGKEKLTQISAIKSIDNYCDLLTKADGLITINYNKRTYDNGVFKIIDNKMYYNFSIESLSKEFSIHILNKPSVKKRRDMLSDIYYLHIDKLDDNIIKNKFLIGLQIGNKTLGFKDKLNDFINKVALGIISAFIIMFVLKYYGYWPF